MPMTIKSARPLGEIYQVYVKFSSNTRCDGERHRIPIRRTRSATRQYSVTYFFLNMHLHGAKCVKLQLLVVLVVQ
jgi:hypothetical protein